MGNVFNKSIQDMKTKEQMDQKENYINKMLKKFGLIYSFDQNKISVSDTTVWEKVSMMERVFYKMPSTTNSLESSQLNWTLIYHAFIF